MLRVWALLFIMAFGVVFLIHRPTEWVTIPYSEEFPKIPGDVFWYHLGEHIIAIINALILLSFFRWPAEKEYYPAYATYFIIMIVDMILFRLFYRNWPIEEIPYNVVKVAVFGCLTLALQLKTIWKKHR